LPLISKIPKKGKAMDEEKILTPEEIKRILEAVLFAAGHPVTFAKLAEVIGIREKEVALLVSEYAKEYESCGLPRGIQLLQLGNACQLVTKEVFAPYVKQTLGVKDGGNLSKASLETLAVIAYNQPVTRAYIDQVRGVESAYSIGVLMERELICEMGRMDVPGRPRLYGTTEVFLRVFGLSDISELPPLAIAGGESK
jgi:segregation and condensation protein B